MDFLKSSLLIRNPIQLLLWSTIIVEYFSFLITHLNECHVSYLLTYQLHV